MSFATDRRLHRPEDLETLRFDVRGLVPVVALQADPERVVRTGARTASGSPAEIPAVDANQGAMAEAPGTTAPAGSVLMLAWANRDALERSLSTGFMHYWSRSRAALWKKGETSGNVQRLVSLHADCDADTVLARVRSAGPACHTGDPTCFGRGSSPARAPVEVPSATADDPTMPGRDTPDTALGELWATLVERDRQRPEGSYTVRLLEDENLRLKKLGEETVELVTALVRADGRAPEEAADLLYHLLVSLRAAGHDWNDVALALKRRRG